MEDLYNFNLPKYKITKPIRLIELFSGYGSQALALKYLGVPFEHWKTCEWAVKSIQAYKDIHFMNDNTNYSKDLTKEQLVNYLTNKGISSNYNEPMTTKQIERLGENKLRTTYNNIISTHNLVNIQQVKGSDLQIVDIDKYEYIVTYSFPCQSLSLAGKCEGMTKGNGTRSGMLWEVERILDELYESGENLPQILIMENVPQVHGKKNINDFNMWIKKLKQLGYSNYYQDLNAKNYGIPQNRNRCFMISVLSDYKYEFPKSIELKQKLKDLLEDNVDEKYYLSDKMKEFIATEDEKHQGSLQPVIINKKISKTLTTREGNTRSQESNYICNELPEEYNLKNITDNLGICVKENLKRELCNKLIEENKINEGDIIRHSYTNNRLNNGDKNMGRIESKEKLSPTLDTRCDCLGICVNNESVKQNLRIRKLTPKECFRLMGVKDEDFENCAKNQSNASLYHLAGDSIAITVLMAIFGNLLNTDWQQKAKDNKLI